MTKISESEARDIAVRWGKVCESDPLMAFGKTGLVADQKRLMAALDQLRHFLKHHDEIDRLSAYLQQPCQYEVAAREQGWSVDAGRIVHVHDFDRAVSYRTWAACCEGEDIVVPGDDSDRAK